MRVTLIGISQEFSFGNDKIASHVRAILPNGKTINFLVDEEQIAELLAVQETDKSEEKNAEVGVGEQGTDTDWTDTDTEQQQEEPGSTDESDEIYWAGLPDDVLAPEMKKVMQQVGVAPTLSNADLTRLVDDISERMAAQAEQDLLDTPPRPAKPRPVIGRVQLQQVPHRRSVPKNDLGYPIVQQRAVASTPQDATDEDGVAQL